jgi:hypothetical protein
VPDAKPTVPRSTTTATVATTTTATEPSDATTVKAAAQAAVVAAQAAGAADPGNPELSKAFFEAVLVNITTLSDDPTPGEVLYCTLMAHTGGRLSDNPAIAAWKQVMEQARPAAAQGFLDIKTVDVLDGFADRVVMPAWSDLSDEVKAAYDHVPPQLSWDEDELFTRDDLDEAFKRGWRSNSASDPALAPAHLTVYDGCYPRGLAGVRHLSDVLLPFIEAVYAEEELEDGGKIPPGSLFLLPFRRGQMMVQGYLRMAVEREGAVAVLGTAVAFDRGHPVGSEFLALVGEIPGAILVR